MSNHPALVALLLAPRPWVKTPQGWKIQDLGDRPVTNTCSVKQRLISRPSQNNREASQSRNVRVQGLKGQRRMSVCLSKFIELLDLQGAATDIRRKAYLFHFMLKMMEKYIISTSASSHQQLFKVLETMFNEALQSEYMIGQMKILLAQSLVTLRDNGTAMIGSQRIRNRHLQTVSNMSTKMEQFTFTERVEDGQLTLTDLPKECLLDIIQRFSDHRDILRLGQTCWYFNDLIQDSFVWEKLTQYHFTEKQMMTFVVDSIDLGEYSAWQYMYKCCFKKYGFSGTHMFTDKPVICSACKTLHWMMLGHYCWSSQDGDQTVYLEPIPPADLISILPL